jgi:hypothetical protein
MKLKTILNESTTDGSLESFVYTMRLGIKGGVFTNEMFPLLKKNFLGGVLGSLKGEMSRIPADTKGEFSKYVSQLLKPLENSSNIEQFINRLGLVVDTKNNILSNLGVNEMVMEFGVKDSINWLKSTIKKGKDWWEENKHSILKVIIELIAQIIVEIIFAILSALMKTKVKAPKVKFGGGKFGGGGAGGNW